MVMLQKTWRDLLGTPDADCVVDGRCIVRRSGASFRILWSFDTYQEAELAYQTWLNEKV